MPYTEQEAKDMRDALNLLAQNEAQQAQTQYNADKTIALAWFNTLGINIQTSTTRTQALDNFDQIELLLETEIDVFKRTVLDQKLVEADEKFKEIKRNG